MIKFEVNNDFQSLFHITLPINSSVMTPFALSADFVTPWRSKSPPFGFNGLGELVYRRTYSRPLSRPSISPVPSSVGSASPSPSVPPLPPSPSSSSPPPSSVPHECWCDTVERVVNGTYGLQQRWCDSHHLGWSPSLAQSSAQSMFACMFDMKFLPPGRGLWAMGSPITEQRGMFAALNNCAFVSTEGMEDDDEERCRPFTFLMDASMLGVGVGFDTKGADKMRVYEPGQPVQNEETISMTTTMEMSSASSSVGTGTITSVSTNPILPSRVMVVPDSREGWVDALRQLMSSYTYSGLPSVSFDYSLIRPYGAPILGFGGVASGSSCLSSLLASVRTCLSRRVGSCLTLTDIADIMNLIGKCVVAGNVRRTAEIIFGPHDSEEYLNLKNYEANPHRAEHGWTSNNSVFADIGMAYENVCGHVRTNGEPGFAWLENMKQYGRMNGVPDHRDSRVRGGNPCLEQSLESYELCCLVETFPYRHSSLSDFLSTLKYAYLYAKTVTLGSTHWAATNRVMQRNRRIGCSVSGIAQFVTRHGIETLRQWLTSGYDEVQSRDKQYSEWFGIPRSIKTTSVKPSGTVSLLAGATPGMHYPESRFYIRRMRISADSDLIAPLAAAGYHIEPAIVWQSGTIASPKSTDIVIDSSSGNDTNVTVISSAVAPVPTTLVVSIPIDAGAGIRTIASVSMWEQLSLAAFLQRYWADNQVSCTVTFDPETESAMLAPALDYYQYQLKGISFLPKLKVGAYQQMPYESITEDEYERQIAMLTPLKFADTISYHNESESDRFCDGERCAGEIFKSE